MLRPGRCRVLGMALDVDPSLIRKITLSGFSGDTWAALAGPLALPPASVLAAASPSRSRA